MFRIFSVHRNPLDVTDHVDCFVGRAARFETPTVSGIIGSDSLSSVRSQSLTEEAEVEEEPVESDRTR